MVKSANASHLRTGQGKRAKLRENAETFFCAGRLVDGVPTYRAAPQFTRMEVRNGRLTEAPEPREPQTVDVAPCQALGASGATPGAGATTDGPTAGKLGAACSRASEPALAETQSAKPKGSDVLGYGPYRPGHTLRALKAGKSVREVELAICKTLTRQEARLHLSAAKAILAREALGATPRTRKLEQ